MEKLKKRLMTIGIIGVLLSAYLVDEPNYNSSYEILDCDDAYAECSCGKVYIGNAFFLRNIDDEHAILVEDQRRGKDPNMKIYNSCRINTREDRNDVLEILQKYEEEHPSNWDRTIESMRLEWLMHNISYVFNFEKHRTEDVDLDNEDEIKYKDKILQHLFRV